MQRAQVAEVGRELRRHARGPAAARPRRQQRGVRADADREQPRRLRDRAAQAPRRPVGLGQQVDRRQEHDVVLHRHRQRQRERRPPQAPPVQQQQERQPRHQRGAVPGMEVAELVRQREHRADVERPDERLRRRRHAREIGDEQQQPGEQHHRVQRAIRGAHRQPGGLVQRLADGHRRDAHVGPVGADLRPRAPRRGRVAQDGAVELLDLRGQLLPVDRRAADPRLHRQGERPGPQHRERAQPPARRRGRRGDRRGDRRTRGRRVPGGVHGERGRRLLRPGVHALSVRARAWPGGASAARPCGRRAARPRTARPSRGARSRPRAGRRPPTSAGAPAARRRRP